MKQQTLAIAADQGAGYEHYRKPTRREEFLKTMNAIVPWAALPDAHDFIVQPLAGKTD